MPFDLCGWYGTRYCKFLKLVGGPLFQARFLKIFGIYLARPFFICPLPLHLGSTHPRVRTSDWNDCSQIRAVGTVSIDGSTPRKGHSLSVVQRVRTEVR